MRAEITPGSWHVLPDPLLKNLHPYHKARYVATSTETEIYSQGNYSQGREEEKAWRFTEPDGVLICTLPDSEHQHANAAAISALPETIALLKDLREWCAQMGGFEAPVWDRLKLVLRAIEARRDEL